MLAGNLSIIPISYNAFLILLNLLRVVLQYPVLKVVMLGKVALLQDFQLRHLHIQVHFFLETLVARGKHFHLRKREGNLVHVLGRTHGAFARHYLGDEFLLSLHKLVG